MSQEWSTEEVKAIVADYFAMWEKDLRGQDYKKAEHNRLLRIAIPDRSRSAVEQKHRNISAVLWHLGYPYLRGYKPLANYQGRLRNAVEDWLTATRHLNRFITESVAAPVPPDPGSTKPQAALVKPPTRKEIKALVDDEARRQTSFTRRNYLETEAKNRSLGLAGERVILNYERERLWKEGHGKLADRVEHVAETEGDYLGFDIRSFEVTGQDRLIEVKTTRYGSMTRFFASSNEVETSESKKNLYHLYRLFNFGRDPEFFILSGSLTETCLLKPANYSAIPR